MFDFSVMEVLVMAVVPAITLYLLYRVIRVAVRHGIEDAASPRAKPPSSV